MESGRYREHAMKEEDRKRWNRMPLYILIGKMEAGELLLVIRDGYIWGSEMDLQELGTAHGKARSFPGLSPPDGARYIGRRRCRTGVCLYWKDSGGNYWYDTERGQAFKAEMEAAQKKNKKMASRRNWMPG